MQKPTTSCFDELMDAFDRDSHIRVMAGLMKDIQSRSYDIGIDALKLESALRALLKRSESEIPPGVLWPSDYA